MADSEKSAAVWRTPKLNWRETDFFEASDYNRIKGNAQYLAGELEKLRGAAPELFLYDVSMGYVPTAEFYTNTERAAADVRNAVLNAGATYKTYAAYDSVWDAAALNKIENMQSAAHALLAAETAAQKTLAFTLCGKGDTAIEP